MQNAGKSRIGICYITYVNLYSSEPKATNWGNLILRHFSFNEKCVIKKLA